jgi:o-succinylbenzoate synthase
MTRRQGEPPFVVSIAMRDRFRGLTHREALLIEGECGWGEFSPFWDYEDRECLPWLRAAHEAADVEWPTPVRNHVPVNATVPAVGPDRAGELVRQSGGCRTVKVKVAEGDQNPEDDIDRVAAVRDALGPRGAVRVDANGGWDADTAVRMIPQLDRAAGGLEYVEQPCRAVSELAAVRRRVNVPIAADESIRRWDDASRVVAADAADILVLKVQPLGGVSACLRIAERCGLPVVVSSALETSIGIGAGVALAAALPDLPHACGLNTARLLTRDVVRNPLVASDGVIPVGRPVPSPELIAAAAADEATTTRWLLRFSAVAAATA